MVLPGALAFAIWSIPGDRSALTASIIWHPERPEAGRGGFWYPVHVMNQGRRHCSTFDPLGDAVPRFRIDGGMVVLEYKINFHLSSVLSKNTSP